MENTLEFIDRLSMAEAKQLLGVESINLKLNPETNHYFALNSVGKVIEDLVVSTKLNIDAKNICVSEVSGTRTNKKTGEVKTGRFYLLHEQKEGGLPIARSF